MLKFPTDIGRGREHGVIGGERTADFTGFWSRGGDGFQIFCNSPESWRLRDLRRQRFLRRMKLIETVIDLDQGVVDRLDGLLVLIEDIGYV